VAGAGRTDVPVYHSGPAGLAKKRRPDQEERGNNEIRPRLLGRGALVPFKTAGSASARSNWFQFRPFEPGGSMSSRVGRFPAG